MTCLPKNHSGPSAARVHASKRTTHAGPGLGPSAGPKCMCPKGREPMHARPSSVHLRYVNRMPLRAVRTDSSSRWRHKKGDSDSGMPGPLVTVKRVAPLVGQEQRRESRTNRPSTVNRNHRIQIAASRKPFFARTHNVSLALSV